MFINDTIHICSRRAHTLALQIIILLQSLLTQCNYFKSSISSIIFCLGMTEMFRLVYKQMFLEKYDVLLVTGQKFKMGGNNFSVSAVS